MLSGKIDGIEFKINFNPFKVYSTDPGIINLLTDISAVIYDPHNGSRIAAITEGPKEAYYILNDLASGLEISLEIDTMPDIGEEEVFIVNR